MREGIYRDKFQVGDSVTWRDNKWANEVDGRKRFGNGPFLITKVREVQVNFEAVGHTQHVLADGAGPHEWSGAFFRKV